MAQNITLLGASYTAVPAVQLPKTGGGTAKFSDASITTAGPSDVAEGKIFLLADGTQATGTASGGGGSSTLITKTITANGTYSAEDDDADGYSSVTVNVPSSAASSWTKVAETSYQVSTTSTSSATVDTYATGRSDLWTSNKWVYVRIRDTAGKRAGYFYGSDQFFYNIIPANGATGTSVGTALRTYIRYTTAGVFSVAAATGADGYGIWADTLYSDGRVRIRRRYSNTNSLTINGTYKVEVYLLDPAGGIPIFT